MLRCQDDRIQSVLKTRNMRGMRLTKHLPEPAKKALKSSFLFPMYRRMSIRRQMMADFPYCIVIGVTTKCNLQCTYCPRSVMDSRSLGKDMDFELFKETVDQASKTAENRTVITPVGLGEPLMYDRFRDALVYLRGKCPDVPISIDTNGTLLDTENSRMLCKCLSNAHDVLLVSLNAANRTSYVALNKADKFDLVVRNIRGFLETRRELGRGPRLGLQILDSNPADEIEDFRSCWGPLIGPRDLVSVKPLSDWGGRVESEIAKKYADALRKIPRYPCLSPFIMAFIHVDGSVYPCCQALAEEESDLLLGNIEKESLRDLCTSARIREIKAEHLKGNWNAFRDCKRCATYTSYPNLWFKLWNRWL